MSKLTLYNYFRSSTSFRVRIALELKKLEYTYQTVHLLNHGGEQNLPFYRQLNPMGGVPTLVHELPTETGQTETRQIGQSIAIIEYLDDTFPQSYQLFPKEAYLKALVKQFCENINADTHAYGNLRTLQYLEKHFHVNEEQKMQWIHHWTLSGLEACEKMLNLHSGLFCFGDQITAADAFLIPQIVTAQRFKVPLDAFTKMNQIFNHCMNLESFQKAHPFRQIDTPAELKI